jgi:hypothetical protein
MYIEPPVAVIAKKQTNSGNYHTPNRPFEHEFVEYLSFSKKVTESLTQSPSRTETEHINHEDCRYEQTRYEDQFLDKSHQ